MLVSSFTLVLHLFIKARDLVVGSAVSQAFVCAVSSLFLSYVSMLVFYAMGPYDKSGSKANYFNVDGLDSVSVSRSKYFKLPLVGLFTLDACIGLAWFVAAFISSLGMAFSFTNNNNNNNNNETQKPEDKEDKEEEEEVAAASKKIYMMFHPYGVHLLVMFPCLFIMIVTSSSSSATYGSFIAYAIAWGAYVLMMYLNIIYRDAAAADSTDGLLYYAINQLFIRFFLTGVTLFSYLLHTGLSFEHGVILLTLLVVSVVCSFDVLSLLSFITVELWKLCFGVELHIPAMDTFFGREWEKTHRSSSSRHTGNKNNNNNNNNSNVNAQLLPSGEPPPTQTNTSSSQLKSMFNISPNKFSSNRSYKLIDPAAVDLNQPWQSVAVAGDREKSV